MPTSALPPSGGRTKSPQLRKQDLSACQASLLALVQDINFGRIEGLLVRDGEPVITPRPIVVREHKFCSENGVRSELGATDFLLKQQVIELLSLLDKLQDGVIEVLDVKHGLPFRAIVREAITQ